MARKPSISSTTVSLLCGPRHSGQFMKKIITAVENTLPYIALMFFIFQLMRWAMTGFRVVGL